jgi:shikimate kinase
MERRLKNITTRGIVLVAGESLREMYNERIPLYEKYADITINGSDTDFETVVGDIINNLEKY